MRLCRNPVPQYGGMDCVGDESDTIPCNTDPCPVPGEWQSWSSWSICLNFCGLSNSSRTRECKISSTGHNCAGSEDMEETENKLCIASDPCEDDFHWGPWGHFTACSKTCGTTTMRERVRTCVWNDDVYQKARPCNDQKIQKLMCGARECPIDGSWGEWSTWGPCSVSCEKGVQLRMRLCNNPKPAFGGKDCEGSKTGSQMEKKECVRQGCPSGRYLNSPTTLRHCKPETGKSSVVWPWTFAGVTQNASCPAGTSGTAFRLCSQNQIWQEEDLTACTSEKVKKIVDKIEEANVGTSTGFSAISTEILQILEGDTKGKHLSVAGDILQLHGMLNKLLDWKPSTFSDLSRAAKLEYVDTITTSVEKITNLKYQNIWMSLNGSTALDLLNNFLTLIENTSLYGQDVIESDTSVIYKNNLNQDFNLFLKTVRPNNEARLFTFPLENTPEYEMEKSTISVVLDSRVWQLNGEFSLAKLMFVKYNTMSKFIHNLNENITQVTGRAFGRRNINGPLIGAMVRYKGMENITEQKIQVRIEFVHNRRAKNPICVYLDERKGRWLYNEGGCRLDVVWSTPELSICICDHLTTFAVLTHDLLDEDTQRAIDQRNFRTFYLHASLAGTMGMAAIFALILAAIVSLKLESGLPVHTVLSHGLKHGAILCAVTFSDSNAMCAVTASFFVYMCTVTTTIAMINCLDVLMDIRCGRKRSQDNYSFIGWIFPLFLVIMILVTYGISSSQDATITCKETYSVVVLLPAITIVSFTAIMSLSLLIYSTRVFSASMIKPLEANRIERRLWSIVFLLLVTFASVALLMWSFVDQATPPQEIQIAYVSILGVEIFYIGFMHLWMDLEFRTYYYKKFGAKPVKEKVMAQPPKYIP
ncbi:adhesion G protein-coupled receptor B1-like [Styela clava]